VRPEVLAEHVGATIKALEAARDIRDARRDAALAELRRMNTDLRDRVAQLEGRLRDVESESALERSR